MHQAKQVCLGHLIHFLPAALTSIPPWLAKSVVSSLVVGQQRHQVIGLQGHKQGLQWECLLAEEALDNTKHLHAMEWTYSSIEVVKSRPTPHGMEVTSVVIATVTTRLSCRRGAWSRHRAARTQARRVA